MLLRSVALLIWAGRVGVGVSGGGVGGAIVTKYYIHNYTVLERC